MNSLAPSTPSLLNVSHEQSSSQSKELIDEGEAVPTSRSQRFWTRRKIIWVGLVLAIVIIVLAVVLPVVLVVTKKGGGNVAGTTPPLGTGSPVSAVWHPFLALKV